MGAGSTFAAPLQNAAQALYQARNINASINGYQGVGSGTGETDILKKVVDWGGSDVPMSQADINSKEPSGDNYTVSQFLQVPIGLGGVAIPYHVPGLTAKTTLTLTAAVLANIYLGHIKYWNSPAIKALNPKVSLPHNQIVVVARADSSGTTYIFTDFLRREGYDGVANFGLEDPVDAARRGGSRAAGTRGSRADVENTPNSIGYVEYSYVLLNPSLLKGVATIVNIEERQRGGTSVDSRYRGPAAAAKADVTATNFSIVWQPGKTTYPIAGYTWAIIWKQNQTIDAEGTLLVKYLDWLSHSGAVDGTTRLESQRSRVTFPFRRTSRRWRVPRLLQVTGLRRKPLPCPPTGAERRGG